MPPKAKTKVQAAQANTKKKVSRANAKEDALKTRPVKAKTDPTPKSAAVKRPSAPKKPAKKPAKKPVKAPVELQATKPEPEPKATTAPSKKRARENDPVVESKPAKRAKKEKEINTPPSERLDIYVFGSGDNGELGLGPNIRNGKKPKNVQRPRLNDLLDAKTVGVVQIAVGGMHCIALTRDNMLYTWGVNDLGALGRDTKKDLVPEDEDSDSDDEDDFDLNPKECTPAAIPSELFPADVTFAQVVASDSASFVLTTTGSVYGWGTFSGADGVIGFTKAGSLAAMASKTKDIQRTPMLIPELKKIKTLSAGGNHILALDHSGNTFTWGCGEQNQLGRRIVERHRVQALVPSSFSLPKRKVKFITCGTFHSFAIDDKNRVFSWGLNNFGQTGIRENAGEANAVIPEPEVVRALGEYKIKDIAGGNHHSIACTEDGKVLVWGRCDDSQPGMDLDDLPKDSLINNGQGKPTILADPTVVPDVTAVSVSAGIDNSIVLTKNGEVYSWGFSANYRTGLGTDEPIEEVTKIENSALVGKKITFSDCGGQFSVLAGPAVN